MFNKLFRTVKRNKEVIFIAAAAIAGYYIYKDYMMRHSEGFAGGEGKINMMFFGTKWCGHCNEFKPIWEKFKKKVKNNTNYEGKVVLNEYDGDKDKAIFSKYNVKAFPHIILEDANKNVHEFKGGRNVAELTAFLNEYVE
jgi:thiol-disulfide isomerase/thioredoxin